MTNNPKTLYIVAVAAILTLIAAYFLFWQDISSWISKQSPAPTPTSTGQKTYDNELYKFTYPNILALEEAGSRVTLKHSVPHEHGSPCDFKGDAPPLKEVVDFHAIFEVLDKNLDGAVGTKFAYIKNDIIENGQMKIGSGNVQVYAEGDLEGYLVAMGVEGCGLDTYFFPLNTNQTLVVERPYGPERTNLITNSQEFLSLPGILTVEEELRIFRKILGSFKFVGMTGETRIKVFFSNERMRPIDSCREVVAAERTIPKTERVALAAIEELLKGPTEAEKQAGYSSNIPAGSRVNSVVITNGEARVDFNATIESGGGSCSMAFRTEQIRQTLLQFPTVKSVKISINGRTEDIFQP